MQSDDRRSAARWTRREFVRGAAGVVVLPHLPHAVTAATAAPQFAYVASGLGSLDVFRLQGERWTRIKCVPSRAPAFVLLSTAQRTLYVANEVDVHEGLPRGTVESFHIDPFDGRLTLSGRTPLSLSATHPRHMALSPDGKIPRRGCVWRRNLQPLSPRGGRQPAAGEWHFQTGWLRTRCPFAGIRASPYARV